MKSEWVRNSGADFAHCACVASSARRLRPLCNLEQLLRLALGHRNQHLLLVLLVPPLQASRLLQLAARPPVARRRVVVALRAEVSVRRKITQSRRDARQTTTRDGREVRDGRVVTALASTFLVRQNCAVQVESGGLVQLPEHSLSAKTFNQTEHITACHI